jgi:hypothetical protein
MPLCPYAFVPREELGFEFIDLNVPTHAVI